MFALLTGSLMARTLAAICALLSITIMIAVLGAVYSTTQDARQALGERARLTVESLAGGASEALWNLDEAEATAVIGSLSRDPDYVGSLILDESGKPFARHGLGVTERPDLIVARTVLTRDTKQAGAQRIGTMELALTTTRADRESARRGWEIALVGGVVLVLVCGALAWIIHGVTRPIIGMTNVMTDLAAGNVNVPVPAVAFDDEVGRMAAALRTLKSHAEERLRFMAAQSRQMEDIERAVDERTRELRDALDTLRRAQDELVRSEKMAALGGMVAAIAHEINTPLGNSLTVATTLGERIDDFAKLLNGTELRRSTLREFSAKFVAGNHLLTANLTRAAELIGSFKRVAVDQTSERRRAFDLATTVAEIVTMLRPTYKKTGHRIETEIPPGVAMDGYPGALGQVLTNLVTNAVLHAFDGRDNGVITIAITEAGAETVVLTVTDDGVGIAGEVLPRIFDSFFTTKLGSGGSGLGLHIVYATVTKVLGGRIGVESRPDVGTTFSIALPRRAPDHATAGERTADVAVAD